VASDKCEPVTRIQTRIRQKAVINGSAIGSQSREAFAQSIGLLLIERVHRILIFPSLPCDTISALKNRGLDFERRTRLGSDCSSP
jgi:hypothetical protein